MAYPPSSKDKIRKELQELQTKAQTLSKEELDRDLAELSNDIEFLEAQVKADIGSFSPAELEGAGEKIVHSKQKAEILRIELDKRE